MSPFGINKVMGVLQEVLVFLANAVKFPACCLAVPNNLLNTHTHTHNLYRRNFLFVYIYMYARETRAVTLIYRGLV